MKFGSIQEFSDYVRKQKNAEIQAKRTRNKDLILSVAYATLDSNRKEN